MVPVERVRAVCASFGTLLIQFCRTQPAALFFRLRTFIHGPPRVDDMPPYMLDPALFGSTDRCSANRADFAAYVEHLLCLTANTLVAGGELNTRTGILNSTNSLTSAVT